jgi:CBS domain-containing protein
MRVKDIMSLHPACCTPESKLGEAARIMAQEDCGAVPVVDAETGRKPLGIVTDRDIVCRVVAAGKDPAQVSVASCMSKPLATVREDSPIEACFAAMENAKVRRMLVVDERGDLCGIVSQADVALRTDPDHTAEVVREISEPTREPSLVC